MIDLKSWQAPKSILDNPWARKLLEIMHTLVDHSRGRMRLRELAEVPAPVRLPPSADLAAARRMAGEP